MSAVMKKSAVILIVVFIGYYLFTNPAGLATTARDGGTALWNALTGLFDTLIRFINALFG
ncbi:MAG TPA: hypothetical protein PKK40_09480 [Marmoricola sp.]|nr:hypothetical protein [Marmoricola sp.]